MNPDRRRILSRLVGSLATVGTATLSAGLAGCATWIAAQSGRLLGSPPPGLPARAELTRVPFFAQTRWHCGPAALATVLAEIGLPRSPEWLVGEVFLPARQGTLQLEMLAGARRQGALAVELPGHIEALLREVAAGRPVLVLQNLGLSFAPLWHYAVVVGYDLERAEVYLRSGEIERQSLSLATFEVTWARGGHWAFVALRPGSLPVAADEAHLLKAAIAFERSAPPTSAVLVYAALLQRWPGNLGAAIGLGNASQAAGDWPGAQRAFESAALRHDSAAAWNNLAQARLALGDRAAARQAALRAVARAELVEPRWRDEARRTLQEIGE